MSELVLNVHDIDESGKDYVFSLSTTWLAGALADTGVSSEDEGRFELHAHKQGLDVVIQGTLVARLETECARCLSAAEIAVSTRVTSLLTSRAAEHRPVAGEVELTPEDLDRDFFTGDRIVLDEMVREHLLLEVPIKPLCRDDCEGIAVPASISGPADLRTSETGGVDPRLAPLMNLVDKLEPSEE